MSVGPALCVVCGGEMTAQHHPKTVYTKGGYYVKCNTCAMARMMLYMTKANAIRYWNEWVACGCKPHRRSIG